MEEKYKSLSLRSQLCFPLYAASREMIKRYRPHLDKIGLTYTQYIVMMVFWEEKTQNVKQLGEKLYLDSGTLTPVLKTLEAKGYLVRSRSKDISLDYIHQIIAQLILSSEAGFKLGDGADKMVANSAAGDLIEGDSRIHDYLRRGYVLNHIEFS